MEFKFEIDVTQVIRDEIRKKVNVKISEAIDLDANIQNAINSNVGQLVSDLKNKIEISIKD